MSEKKVGHNSKKDFLKNPVEHIDITSFDARKIISSMEKMSFVSSVRYSFLSRVKMTGHVQIEKPIAFSKLRTLSPTQKTTTGDRQQIWY